MYFLWDFSTSETIGKFFQKETVLFISNCIRKKKRIKGNMWFRAHFALTFRSEEHHKLEKFQTANNMFFKNYRFHIESSPMKFCMDHSKKTPAICFFMKILQIFRNICLISRNFLYLKYNQTFLIIQWISNHG